MAKRRSYPPEFRQQLVELVRAGRTPEELSREFEASAQAIRNWVRRAEVDAGRRTGDLSSQEHEELKRLRRENKLQLRWMGGQLNPEALDGTIPEAEPGGGGKRRDDST